MVNERPCEYCKDYTIKKMSENKIKYLQLNYVYSMTKHLTAHEQKTLSRHLKISEKTIRLFFRKKRAKDTETETESETEQITDISTTCSCDNDRIPHYHIHHYHCHNHRCHFSAAANQAVSK